MQRCGNACAVDQNALLLGRELPLHVHCVERVDHTLHVQWAADIHLWRSATGTVWLSHIHTFRQYPSIAVALDALTDLLGCVYHLE